MRQNYNKGLGWNIITGIDDAILFINEAKNAAIAIVKARLFNEVNVQKSKSKLLGYSVPIPTNHFKKLLNWSLLACLLFSSAMVYSQSQQSDPETRLKELGITLKTPGPPTANFVGAIRVGKMVYLSGHGPLQANGKYMIGKVGDKFNLEQAQAAARLTGINLLAALKAEVGNLNNVKRIVKVLGMVNAVPTFDDHSRVINGFSDLMVEVFGENGKHARSAIGLGSLPRNIPVEIEMIVEMKE